MLAHGPQTNLYTQESNLQLCLNLSGPTLHKKINCAMLVHGFYDKNNLYNVGLICLV